MRAITPTQFLHLEELIHYYGDFVRDGYTTKAVSEAFLENSVKFIHKLTHDKGDVMIKS